MTHATSGDNRIDLAALYICAASPSGSAPSRPARDNAVVSGVELMPA